MNGNDGRGMAVILVYVGLALAAGFIVALLLTIMLKTTDPALAATFGGKTTALQRGIYLTSLGHAIYVSAFRWVLIFAPFIIGIFFVWRAKTMGSVGVVLTLGAFAIALGASGAATFGGRTTALQRGIYLNDSQGFRGL